MQIFHQGDLLVTIFSSIYTRVSPSGQLFTLINCFLSQGVFIPKLPTYLPTSTVTAVSMYNLAFSQFSFGFVPPLFPEDNPWGEVSGILSEVVTCVNFLSPNQVPKHWRKLKAWTPTNGWPHLLLPFFLSLSKHLIENSLITAGEQTHRDKT